MFFTASSTFCPSRRTPSTTSSEMFVALWSSRTRTTVPSRMSRTTSSPAKSRSFQASQSVLILRHREAIRRRQAPQSGACAADDVLAHRTLEQGSQRALDPARVGARKVGARNQRLHLARHPGVARQSGAAPLLCAPALDRHACPWHADLNRTEAAQQLALARPVPVALRRFHIPLVAPASQRRVQLLPDQLLDEPAHPLPDARLDRVKPGVPGKQRRAVRIRLRAILLHGVVSAGAETPEMAR